jgi:peptidyl-prolyl cis-trans isomerase SurA
MPILRLRHTFQTLRFCGRVPAALRALSLCLVFLGGRFAAGVEIDRLIAAVNGVVVTEGDLNLARSLNAILFYGKNAEASSRSEDIERLIERELMRQELQNFSMAEAEDRDVEARLRSLRDAFAPKGGLSALLQRTGLRESELISHIRLESSILRFVDFRFRPFVSVSEEEIKTYYETRLVPQLRVSKIELPALDQISAKIEVILREEKVNTVLDQWMKEVRRSSRIEYFDDAQSPLNAGTSEF